MSFHAYIVLLFCLAALMFASAVAALVWALRRRQFDHMQAGATSIFDEDEPEGQVTDHFPRRKSRAKRAQKEVAR
jgi:cbb3-type cytochrome oxidase maturation protein